MNWSQAPASRLSVVAGLNSSRVISVWLTMRGFGERISGIGSGNVMSIGALRPNRVPALPIAGFSRSLKVPSGERDVRYRLSGAGAVCGSVGAVDVSCRLWRRRSLRRPTRTARPTHGGSRCHPRRSSSAREARTSATVSGPCRDELLDPFVRAKKTITTANTAPSKPSLPTFNDLRMELRPLFLEVAVPYAARKQCRIKIDRTSSYAPQTLPAIGRFAHDGLHRQ